MATTLIDEIRRNNIELKNLREEMIRIKDVIITEERLIQIFRNELDTQEGKYKDEFKKIQRQVAQIKNNPSESSGLDFSDFQPPPSLPWGKPFENRNEKDKRKQIANNED